MHPPFPVRTGRYRISCASEDRSPPILTSRLPMLVVTRLDFLSQREEERLDSGIACPQTLDPVEGPQNGCMMAAVIELANSCRAPAADVLRQVHGNLPVEYSGLGVALDAKTVAAIGLCWVSVVPDLGLSQEVEPAPVYDLSTAPNGVRAEENGGAEDAFESRDQPAVLLSALLHPEGVQHLRGTFEPDGLALLLDG